MGSDSFTNNLNTNNINLSTKYNNRYNNKPTDSKDFYKSNSNNKFFSSSGLKFNEQIKLNFNSMKNYLYFNRMNKNKLPIIKQLKKSSSVSNFDGIKYNKKSKLTIEKGNIHFQNNMINF